MADLETIRLFLDRGADLHADNNYSLRAVCRLGYLEIVRLLLDRGANLRADNDYSLRIASQNGHLETVRLLLEHGAVITQDFINNSSPGIIDFLLGLGLRLEEFDLDPLNRYPTIEQWSVESIYFGKLCRD